jgi:hypothetical protein
LHLWNFYYTIMAARRSSLPEIHETRPLLVRYPGGNRRSGHRCPVLFFSRRGELGYRAEDTPQGVVGNYILALEKEEWGEKPPQ